MNKPEHNNDSALHKILTWSAMLPDWGRDALRRIVQNGLCSKQDVQEIFNIAIHDVPGFSFPDSTLNAQPLSNEHLPPSPGDEQSVTLNSIKNLQFVNRLPSDQSIPFKQNAGINIVFGNNGSGKSGYARVLKKACRARGSAQEIKPNAFSDIDAEPARACINFSVAGNEVPPFDWVDNYPTDNMLSNVFVFDTDSAENYLTYDDTTSFTPFGLDILPKLTTVYDNIQKMIANEITIIETKNESLSDLWKYSEGTEVGKILSKLTYSTDRKKLEKLSIFSDEMKRKEYEIENALKSDPQKQIGQTEASIKRLEDFSYKVKSICNVIAIDNIKTIINAIQEYNDADINNKIANKNKYKLSLINGVGSKEWKDFWDKAGEYSKKKAYPENKFPFLDENAFCLLCQQPISTEVKDRLLSFETDFNDSSQETLSQKQNILKQYKDKYSTFADIEPEFTKVEADLKIYLNNEQYILIQKAIEQLSNQFKLIKQNIDNNDSKKISTMDISFKSLIEDTINKFKERLEIEKSANKPEERKKYEIELIELIDKEWLSKNISKVIDYIDNLRKIDNLTDKKSETNTSGITKYAKELTNIFVTEEFCESFKSELKKFGLKSIDVELKPKLGDKAVTKFGLKVKNAEGWKIKQIASEGEQRCIALACFLAELSQSSHNSALVFDDPVSSLDHYFRNCIAERLAKEALTRQVIVFTHDMTFLNDLQAAAEKEKSNISTGYLEWNGLNPGYYYEGLPWDCMKPENRLIELGEIHKELSKATEPYPTENSIAEIRNAYTKLSSTIERIIETVIFNDVINRFRKHVMKGKLRNVVQLTPEEYNEIMPITQRCDDITDRHDPATTYQMSVPNVDQLKKDIDSTRKILLNLRTRQNAMEKK